MKISQNLTETQKRMLKLIAGLFFLILIGYFLVLGPAWALFSKVKDLPEQARPVKDSLLLYDLDKLTRELTKFQTAVKGLGGEVTRLQIFAWVPFFGSYAADARNLYDFSLGSLDLAAKLSEVIKPHAASLGFKSESSKELLAGGQERLVGLTKVAPVLANELPKFKADLERLSQRLSKVDPNRYPEKIGQTIIRPRLVALKEAALGLSSSLEDLVDFFKILPEMMGAGTGRKNYLVIFQNDKELRPSGGFLTAYAVFTLDKGRLSSSAASDSYFIDIDNKLSVYDAAPAVITKYLKLQDNKLFFRDANLSPDFKVSMETVEKIWNRSRLVPRTDGIVALDTHFVESMMEVLGEVALPGYPKFTKENVVEQLELVSNVLGSRLEKRQGRKDIIGLLMQNMLQKAFAAGGKQYLNLITTIWQEAEQKHILVYLHDPTAQALAESRNFAGRIWDYDGDYLHINDANFAGRKANWFMKEEVTKEVKVEKDKIITTLKIDYENTGKYHPDFNTGYRDYVRIYVPPGSKLISGEGSMEPLTTGEDLGKTFFAAYMAVDPLKKVRLTVKYETPRSVVKDNTYRLLIQKQPGAGDFKYEVKVGRKVESFDLLTDREVTIDL